ncbi:hypothetical protein [Kineosporia sp. A_224]|uniref:hypothetical protein n=1 Tax=Kineosporia sp. A_224 TaxID=1962180 RepID=UPI000B4BA92B|nr:hypothetical protein [Kineosporia sp. A_224]
MDLPAALAAVVAAQDGLVHRRQLDEHGVSAETLRWAVGRRWQVVLPGVFATFTGRLDARQRLVAGALFAGPEAALAAASAARWHGLTSLPRAHHLQFLVPSRLAARRQGPVVLRRTDRPDEHAWNRPPLQVCSPARAVADAVRDLRNQDEATALVVEAVQRGVLGLQALRHELEEGPRRWSHLLRNAVAAAELGIWSVPENDLAQLVARSTSLPPMWSNPTVHGPDGTRLPTPDGWLDDVALAIQVHSVRWHAMGSDWEGTVQNDGIYAEYAVPVLAFTPQRIATDARWVVERIERVHAALQDRGRPPVTATPRTPLLVRG